MIAALTARRAGWRRVGARVRRYVSLRWLHPRFAAWLYPLHSVAQFAVAETDEFIPLSARSASSPWTNQVSLLNASGFALCPPVDWNANPIGHTLWAFRLHEFEWAWSLVNAAACGDDASAKTLAELIRDHIENCPIGQGIAWEPYPLSRRLVVWCAAWGVLANRGYAAGFLEQIAPSIDRGARLLAHNVERDLDNNHVIADAKALAFAGTLLNQDYARAGFDLMWQQLRAQVRGDGGHVENSTLYHLLVWRDALETVLLARRHGIPVPDDIIVLLSKMANYLVALRRPDGTFPLLNDSVDEGFSAFDSLLAATEEIGRGITRTNADKNSKSNASARVFDDSGYAVLRCGNTWALFDAGALGPSYCPGHGHADALSFELWADEQLLIADPGVYQYQAGQWRDYFRGAGAHSTVVVDGMDQSEMLGSFRVGAMANAHFTRVQSDHLPLCVQGEHTGYERLRQPIQHRRTLTLSSASELLVEDELLGRGEHDIDLMFHLAPCEDVSIRDDSAVAGFKNGVTLQFSFAIAPLDVISSGATLAPPARAGGNLSKVARDFSQERLEMTEAMQPWSERASSFIVSSQDGWYSPTWYTKQIAPLIHYRGRAQAPVKIRTTLSIHQGKK